MSLNMPELDQENEIDVEKKEPSMYKVLLHNDDYTSVEFVVDILQYTFNKNSEDASRITNEVHLKGIGIAGVYTHDVAETKVELVKNAAKLAEYPLQCTMEAE